MARRSPQQQAEASLSTVCVLATFTKLPLAMVAIIWRRVLEHTASDGSLLSSRGGRDEFLIHQDHDLACGKDICQHPFPVQREGAEWYIEDKLQQFYFLGL